MEVFLKLPFDLQEYILVKVMKRYKLRDGKYVRQIDKTKYTFLDYIMRPIMQPMQPPYYQALFYYKFYIKNLYDNPLRKESCVDDDMVYMRIYYKNNSYRYAISIYRLKLKNIDENNFTPDKMRKDIYHKGSLADKCFWDVFLFSYKVK
jgi:hypothetical protein